MSFNFLEQNSKTVKAFSLKGSTMDVKSDMACIPSIFIKTSQIILGEI